jgi:hypothetical protein
VLLSEQTMSLTCPYLYIQHFAWQPGPQVVQTQFVTKLKTNPITSGVMVIKVITIISYRNFIVTVKLVKICLGGK